MKSKFAVLTILFPVLTVLFMSACASKNKDSDGDVSARAANSEPNPLVPRSWGPNYRYNELLTKDYDEMTAMVQSMIKKAHLATSKEDGSTGGDGEAVEYYGRALKLIFSRPDSDNMVTKLVGEIRRELQGFNSYEDVIESIAAEAIKLTQNREAPVIVQSTALVEIENIMAEIRPEVTNGNPELRRVVQMVRDADLRMSDEVKRDRRLRGMFKTNNPSDEARDLLRALDKKNKKK